MGIVAKQTISNLLITCLGFGLGALNTLFLFTNFMSEEYYGLYNYILSVMNLLWPIMAFGGHNTLVKFYASYTNINQQQRLLSTFLVVPLFFTLIVGVIGVVGYEFLLRYFEEGNSIVQPYIWTIPILAMAMAYFELFFAWSKVKLKSVFGNILKELFVRVGIFGLLILLYFELISQQEFIFYVLGVYLLRMVLMLQYAFRLHQPNFQWSLPENYQSVFKYTFLIFLAGSVAALLIDLDKSMIEMYLSIENIAKYSICAYVASVINMPSRAMHQITYPLTSKLLNEQNFEELKTLYTKSAANLLAVAGLLFVLILCNVNQLFRLIPSEYSLFIWVVLFIGCVKLFDSLLGNANSILHNSDYYRLILYMGVGMVVLMVLLNVYCIPRYGVDGAAFATFVSVFIFNSLKFWIIWKKFGLHPFTSKILINLVLISGVFLGFYFWDFKIHPILAIVLKGSMVAGVYLGLMFSLNLSDDISVFIKKKISRGA